MIKKSTTTSRFELSWPIIFILALLPIIRAAGHDLRIIEEKTFLNFLLAIVPLIIWLIVVLVRKVRSPLKTLLIVGLVYGLFLALTHQLMWDSFWGSSPPKIGGNLAGTFSPMTEQIILRTAAFISSIVTGLVTGAIVGGIATILRRIMIKS